jgi:hypothetical protein
MVCCASKHLNTRSFCGWPIWNQSAPATVRTKTTQWINFLMNARKLYCVPRLKNIFRFFQIEDAFWGVRPEAFPNRRYCRIQK